MNTLNLVEYQIVLEDCESQELNFKDLVRFDFKTEAQAFAKSQGWRVYDVQKCQTRFATFWIVWDSHFNRAIANNGRIATLIKKEKPLMTGEMFRKLRETECCSINELAQTFNIPPFQINRWERGKAKLEVSQINEMVRYFDTAL